jgi:hypothetical protein
MEELMNHMHASSFHIHKTVKVWFRIIFFKKKVINFVIIFEAFHLNSNL